MPAKKPRWPLNLLLAILLVCVPVIGVVWWQQKKRSEPIRFARPYGMAPVAFEAYLRACVAAKVNPRRITQTIGDAPLSVRYHWKDGIVTHQGIHYDYCAAVDIGTGDMSRQQVENLQCALQREGFVGWYRHTGKFEGRDHIHAIYAFLPMKRQLRGQVLQFLPERREADLPPLKWEKKLRHSRHFKRYL